MGFPKDHYTYHFICEVSNRSARVAAHPGRLHCGSVILGVMTTVQVQIRLQRPLDDASLTRLAGAFSIYGIQKIRLGSVPDSLLVEYDATRLRPAEVRSALAQAGIAVAPIQ
jgi:hypothetical protein